MASEFDQYAGSYSNVLNAALSSTGETKEYFALRRVQHYAACLSRLQVRPTRVLDFGCGPGTTSQLLLEHLGCSEVIGIDPSAECISEARRTHSGARTIFFEAAEFRPSGDVEAAYCNGVFHHILPAARIAALRSIRESLRPGGIFGFWENNPWNPGTKYVMSQCAFDEDAITISPREARRLLRSAGFDVLRVDFLFFLPRRLRRLRSIEPVLRKVPLGGQYQVLCRRPRQGLLAG